MEKITIMPLDLSLGLMLVTKSSKPCLMKMGRVGQGCLRAEVQLNLIRLLNGFDMLNLYTD